MRQLIIQHLNGGEVHIYLHLAGVSSSTMINKSQADMCEAETIPEKSSKAAGRINVSSQRHSLLSFISLLT